MEKASNQKSTSLRSCPIVCGGDDGLLGRASSGVCSVACSTGIAFSTSPSGSRTTSILVGNIRRNTAARMWVIPAIMANTVRKRPTSSSPSVVEKNADAKNERNRGESPKNAVDAPVAMPSSINVNRRSA